jgi:hypothetical protein
VALAHLVPLLTGHDDHRDAVTWLDVDDTMRETFGYDKQGVGYGCNKAKVRREAPVRREALRTEGGVRPPRRVVAAAWWELSAA